MVINHLDINVQKFGIDFLPVIEIVIQSDRHRIALTDLVIAHGGNSVFVDEAVAAEHTVDQLGGMMSPVAQIGA